MTRLETYRRNISNVARAEVGAHYIHGGFGNVPGVANGHPTYPTRVVTADRVSTWPRQILFAAKCHSNRLAYCAGRFREMERIGRRPIAESDLRDPTRLAELQRTPDSYLWPRPYDRAEGPIVHGESCVGKRHFDCVGFIDWCIFKACGFRTRTDIEHYHRRGFSNSRLTVTIDHVRPGDLLINRLPHQHIAVVIDQDQVAQAVSTDWGVKVSALRTSGNWEMCLRLDDGFFQ